jgi:hypothetical protein
MNLEGYEKQRLESRYWHHPVKGCVVYSLPKTTIHRLQLPQKFCRTCQASVCRSQDCYWQLAYHYDDESREILPLRYRRYVKQLI